MCWAVVVKQLARVGMVPTAAAQERRRDSEEPGFAVLEPGSASAAAAAPAEDAGRAGTALDGTAPLPRKRQRCEGLERAAARLASRPRRLPGGDPLDVRPNPRLWFCTNKLL